MIHSQITLQHCITNYLVSVLLPHYLTQLILSHDPGSVLTFYEAGTMMEMKKRRLDCHRNETDMSCAEANAPLVVSTPVEVTDTLQKISTRLESRCLTMESQTQ